MNAANALTARWCAAAGEGDFVVSGAGVWPLLALLAGAADGPARAELGAALGVPAARAHAGGLEVLDLLAGSDDVSAALGFWVRDDLPIRPQWQESVPAGTVAPLTGQEALDDWSSRHTGGLIEHLPITVDRDTLMVLATALAANTTWRHPFSPMGLTPQDGRWGGRRLAGLTRSTSDVDCVATLAADVPVTRVVVTGRGDADVHLLFGPEHPAAAIRAGIAALAGTVPVRTGSAVDGPGLTRREVHGPAQQDTLRIELPKFAIRSHHDLLAHPTLFGLGAASDPRSGHFPGISPDPLAVQQGAQDVLAEFREDGFTAAAVTAFGLMRATAAARRPPERTTTELQVRFDRPFGFLLVHRESRLAVVAGWVADPAVTH